MNCIEYFNEVVRKDSLPPETPWLRGLDDSPAPPFEKQLRDAPDGVLITMYVRDSSTDSFDYVQIARLNLGGQEDE